MIDGFKEKLDKPISQAAEVVGLDKDGSASALKHLWPVLSAALKDSLKSPRDVTALMGLAKTGGNYIRYMEEPTSLAEPQAIEDGEAVLKIVLGSDSVQNQIARQAANAAELDFQKVDNFMSLLASLMMATVAMQMRDTDFAAVAAKGALTMVGLGGLTGMVDKHMTKANRKKLGGKAFGALKGSLIK